MTSVLVYYLGVASGAFGATLSSTMLVPAAVPAPYAWLIRASTVLQDNALREIAGASLFTARAVAGATHGELAIWSAMAVLNLLVAAAIVAWSRRASARWTQRA